MLQINLCFKSSRELIKMNCKWRLFHFHISFTIYIYCLCVQFTLTHSTKKFFLDERNFRHHNFSFCVNSSLYVKPIIIFFFSKLGAFMPNEICFCETSKVYLWQCIIYWSFNILVNLELKWERWVAAILSMPELNLKYTKRLPCAKFEINLSILSIVILRANQKLLELLRMY